MDLFTSKVEGSLIGVQFYNKFAIYLHAVNILSRLKIRRSDPLFESILHFLLISIPERTVRITSVSKYLTHLYYQTNSTNAVLLDIYANFSYPYVHLYLSLLSVAPSLGPSTDPVLS